MESSARKIQKAFRNFYGRKKILTQLRSDVDEFIRNFNSVTLPATDVFAAGEVLLFLFNFEIDRKRLVNFCNIILTGMETNNVKMWYVSLSLNKCYAVVWMKQTKKLLALLISEIKTLKLGVPEDESSAEIYLSLIMTLSDYSLWKLTVEAGVSTKPVLHQLCVTFVDCILEKGFYPTMNQLLLQGLLSLSPSSLMAAAGVRLLALKSFAPDVVMSFVYHVLSIPGSMFHLCYSSPKVIENLQKVDFCSQVTKVLMGTKSFNAGLSSNSAISIVCNLLYLALQEGKRLLDTKKKSDFVNLMLHLLPLCEDSELEPECNACFWHPLFGWCKGEIDVRLMKLFTYVHKQLQCLWHPAFLNVFFSDVFQPNPGNVDKRTRQPFLSCVCEMYLLFISTVKNFKSDILIGLGCNDSVVFEIWCFFKDTTMLDIKEIIGTKSYLSLLSLLSQMMVYMLNILDDFQLFEKQKSFKSEDFANITMFLNNLLFRVIWEEKELSQFFHCQELMSMLYNRDCKRHFCHKEHWHLKGFKARLLMKELDSRTHRGFRILRQLPHLYPHSKRVEIFHQQIKKDKERLGISAQPTTYITIHRDKLLEDGYSQLGILSSSSLKATIRVKFINTQGLDEAGIDEMGVFKEFLEETLNLAFNPALNLFKANTEGHLFPSYLSGVNENHLQLFQFVGRMLGKAVYEGIVVDIPLAPFFLSHLLQRHHSTCYNYLDELSSFDKQIYTSLNFIKHYDGDVTDLGLTFSVEEDYLGKRVTHELVDGGCTIPVSSSNRLSYVHRMALFKLSTQIKKQTDAFAKGFHSLIEPSFIEMFSPQELQKLISGDEVDIDVDDLRKHTQYSGGYHANHKVVLWLWDILKNHFSAIERGQFLKFVTSCSRPPLLGFKHLQPPFTIRCIQMTHSEESEESVTQMIKGLFKRHQPTDRLPSTSTCFNLLKLPNYTSRNILKEKLKYAVQANCGFELS